MAQALPKDFIVSPACIAESASDPASSPDVVIASAPEVLPEIEPTPETVGRLLAQSNSHAKQRAHYANSKPPNYAQATIEAAHALAERNEAHDLDSEHADPAWQAERVPHAVMVEFLAHYVVMP
jgi:hypothetical protein